LSNSANIVPSFTNLVGQILEGRLWDINRFKHTTPTEKHLDGTNTGINAPLAPGQVASPASTTV
jgi:hypothetical protein